MGKFGEQLWPRSRSAITGALREHLLSQPAHELAAWAITRHPLRLGQDRWGTADEPAAVASLDPTSIQHRAVARHLRGISNELDVAIATRFAGIDLNAALATQLPAPATTPLPTSSGLEAGTESEPHAVPTAAGAFKIASGALAPDVTDDAKFANRAGPSAARSAAPTAITSPVTTSAVSEQGVWLH
ncbi:hypothetical protein [Pseudonocardia acidicola]|uniref:DUF222 domain-containing protein n=1 Tax=Pseudonocardia acidicola TaxID=2724939 RepID=A0ABX1SL34_9PSEU|nr:hypothetical protein [Pseudonocardia acidicola]NMI01102.1 hypothetical protein [Pseudonocardia acidicola]